MSDSQFAKLCSWIGEKISGFFSMVGTSFEEMEPIHWFSLLILAVVIGFMCMKGMGANQRM